MTISYDDALARLFGVHEQNDHQATALCPAHDDHGASLSIGRGEDGMLLLYCHAGCTFVDIIGALNGMEPGPAASSGHLNGHRKTKQRPKPEMFGVTKHRYPAYRAAKGEDCGTHWRIDFTDREGKPRKWLWWEDATCPLEEMAVWNAQALAKHRPGSRVYVTEGEKKCELLNEALRTAGVDAVAVATMTGAEETPCDAALKPLLQFDVVLWPDADKPDDKHPRGAGQQHMEQIAARLVAMHGRPRWVHWTDAPAKGDVADFLAAGHTMAEVEALVGDVPGGDHQEHRRGEKQTKQQSEKGDKKQKQSRLKLVRVSAIESARVTWLWRRYIPLGELTVAAAGGGAGKTHACLDLAVRVAADLPMPDGTHTSFGGPANVAIFTSENDPQKILRPQLEAMAMARLDGDKQRVRACLDHILVLEGVESEVAAGSGVSVLEALSFPRDLESFRTTCKAEGIKLALFDPLISYTAGNVKVIDQLDVRRFLDPLAGSARECEMAVLGIIHFSKRTEGEFVAKVSGSRQYTDTARSVLSVLVGGPDDDGRTRRWLASAKLNLGATPPAWSFFIEDAPHPTFEDERTSIVRWDHARTIGAEELDSELRAGRQEVGHGADGAADQLRRRLLWLWTRTPRVETVTAKQLETWRDEVGVSDKTWTKAKQQVGVKTRATGKGADWVARLDEVPFLKSYQPSYDASADEKQAG
jgi:hypothetical protein